MNDYKVEPLFSTPLYKSKVRFKTDIFNYLINIKYEELYGDNIDVPNGLISVSNYILNDNNLYGLKESILLNLKIYLRDILQFADDIDFYITTSWVIKHYKNNYSQQHRHRNSLFSGVVYLQVDGESGAIKFTDDRSSPLFPHQLHLRCKSTNIYNARSFTILPENNDIIIFPSNLMHEVLPNKSNLVRYTLAFNVYAAGPIGNNFLDDLTLLIS